MLGAECFAFENLGREDLDFDFKMPQESVHAQTYVAECNRLIRKFETELQQAQKIIKPRAAGVFLFEIMCSSDSELTRQGLMQDLRCKRFGLEQGDLRTVHGRRNLFAHLIADRPEHVWISPECKPWCQWSRLNLQKSLELYEKITTDRYNSLWQIALARVLFDWQKQQFKHFHGEQPEGSEMLQTPCMGPIMRGTLMCRFDLCRVGNLLEPVTKKPLRKRLNVFTTSLPLKDSLHERFCKGNHEHQMIAGTTQKGTLSMPLTQYTEKYPRKFARQVIQILKRKQNQLCML